MWSLLALLTASSGSVPPFQLLAMTFMAGSFAGMMLWPFQGGPRTIFRLPAQVWAIGIGGLFLYHFFYYTAIRNAPPAQASLIAYLWPMLIVFGSALLPGERLRWYHIAGVAFGFAGCALLLTEGADDGAVRITIGHASALVCAFVWAAYSILSRRYSDAPGSAVPIFCLFTAFLAGLCHLWFEQTVWPQTPGQWLAIAGLGLMPVGLAFNAWDYGVKHGDIQFLGVLAYASPLISTLLLVLADLARPTASLGLACLMIAAGALIASGRITR